MFHIPLPPSLVARQYAPVLTYHACLKACPDDIAVEDNITPGFLYEHLDALRRLWRFVPIDEFSETTNRKGIAAVTFDDGYKSVIHNALPVLTALDIPCTIFINLIGINQKVFWRHKVMRVIASGLQQECEASFTHIRKLPGQSFYHYLKHPANDSRISELEIDRFIQSKNLAPKISNHLVDDLSYFLDHPLVWYGNHSSNHYVLSSLSLEEQRKEILETDAFLRRLKHIKRSLAFSLPFGESHHVNHDTLSALKDLGYKSLLMNRGRLNRLRAARHDPLPVVERFSPGSEPIGSLIAKEFVRTVVSAPFHLVLS